MSALSPIAPKLRKLLPLLSSDIEGEQLATVAAIKRTLANEGLSIHDLAEALTIVPARSTRSTVSSPPAWAMLSQHQKLLWMRSAAEDSSPGTWEHRFSLDVAGLLLAGWKLTPAQVAKCQQILERLWWKGVHP